MRKFGSWWAGQSTRARLIALMLLAAVPLLADRLLQIHEIRAERLEDAEEKAYGVARYAATVQAELIAKVRLFLRLQARSAEAQIDCNPMPPEVAAEVPWLRSLRFVTPDGWIQNCSDGTRVNIADRPHFREAVARKDFVLSEMLRGRIDEEMHLVGVYPRIDAAGRIERVLVASIDPAWMNRLAKQVADEAALSVFITDKLGTVAGGYPIAEGWRGLGFATPLEIERVLSNADGLVEAVGRDGVERLFAAVPIGDTRAHVVVGIPSDQVSEDLERALWISIAKILGLLLVFVLGVWFGSERLVLKPLRALTEATRRFGEGDLAARVPEQGLPREFRQPAQAFNAMAERLALREAELREANRRLEELAAHDGLTGLANRRSFDERFSAEWNRALRGGGPLALLIVDVDEFKRFNDAYGHPAGDACLRIVAEALRGEARRASDLAARTGGEEFALLLPETGIEDARAIAERIRLDVERRGIVHLGSAAGCVTVSIGVAAIAHVEPGHSGAALYAAADEALYAAKRAGRNRVFAHRKAASALAKAV